MIISRRMRWAGHVACMGEMKVLVGKIREDNIRVDLREIKC
jgi:hypothetical protein